MASQSIIKRKQPIIFWIFLAIAIPATIIVALFSAGYRYNTETRSLTRTAAISLISMPKRATVTLNGEVQSQTTPYIQTTPAGTYHITVTKDGYQAWEKQMNIVPGKSIVFSEIVLFYQEPIVTDVTDSEATTNFAFEFGRIETRDSQVKRGSEDATILEKKGFTDLDELRLITGGSKTLLVDQKNDRTYIVNGLDDETYDIWIDGAITSASWVEKNSFIYGTGTDLWLYQIDTKNMDLIVRGSQAITSVGVHHSGQYFYYTTESGLYAVEYDSRDKRQIWTLWKGAGQFIESVKNNGRIVILTDTQDPTVSVDRKTSVELYEQDTLLP
jgi:hypothetical protein